MVSKRPALTVRPVTAKRRGCIRWRAPFSFSAARPRTASSIAVSVHSGRAVRRSTSSGKFSRTNSLPLLLELGLIVVEGAAVEVADGVGDLGRQGDTLLQEIHDVLEARWVPIELLLRRRARLDEHGGGESSEFLRTPAPEVDGVNGS